MGRETDDEREARLKQAGRWLEAEMEKRGWTQKYLAGELGVAPQQVSAYANGRYQIDPELARDLARIFGLSEYQVWNGMRLARPRLTNEEALRQAMDALPEVMETVPEIYERVTGRKLQEPSPRPRGAVTSRRGDTRKGEKRRNADGGEESAV